MTRQEAIEVLEALWRYKDCGYSEYEIRESLEMAIKVLKQEPCKDCISREQALIGIRNLYPGAPYLRRNFSKWKEKNKIYIECENVIESLPSVAPTRKRGKWKILACDLYMCSKCYSKYTYQFNFCPTCGSEMYC